MSTYNRINDMEMRSYESFNQVDPMIMMVNGNLNADSAPPSMEPDNLPMSVDMMSQMVGSTQDFRENFNEQCEDGDENCNEVCEGDDCHENFENECEDGDCNEECEGDDCRENFEDECENGDCNEDCEGDDCHENFENECEDGDCNESCEDDDSCRESFENECEDGDCNESCEDDDTCRESFTDTKKDLELWTCYPSNLEKSRETFESTDKYTAGGDVSYGPLGKAVASVNESEMNKLYMYLAIGVIALMIIYLLTCRK